VAASRVATEHNNCCCGSPPTVVDDADGPLVTPQTLERTMRQSRAHELASQQLQHDYGPEL
jgi:hypothetical protein